MSYRSSIYWWSDIYFYYYFINIEFVNIYFQIAYIEHQIVFIWSTNPLNNLHVSVCCCFVPGRYTSLGFTLLLVVSREHLIGGDLWRGKTYLYHIILLPLQNPRSLGMSPLGVASLKRKNLPIVVTLGGIGSCYASLTLYFVASSPIYKLCDNTITYESYHILQPLITHEMERNSSLYRGSLIPLTI